ncbi:MAG: peptidase [Flavobacterium sp.]
MSEKRLKKQLLKKKLFAKNRLVILNEDTFEEIFSLKLTLMNVFVVASIGAILIITVTTYIIAFTPLREYIPGYTSTKLKKDATELALKSDSLEFAIKKNELYLESIKKVLNGNLQYAKVNKDSILAIKEDTLPDLQLTATESELKLRQQVADEEEKAKEHLQKKKEKRK